MNKDELNELATKSDLDNLFNRLISIFLVKINPVKEFYTPREFANKTGMKYSTVIYKCTNGTLKAFQEAPNSTWFINASELERFKRGADENTMGREFAGA